LIISFGAGQRFSLPYGRQRVEFTLELPAVVAQPEAGRPLSPCLEAEVSRTLRQPVAGLPLRELARPGMRVCIAVTDATRKTPDAVVLPRILAELSACGVRSEDVVVVVACGLHRPSTQAEKVEKLGAAVLERCRVVDHQAQEAEQRFLGRTSGGVPVAVNRLAVEADLLLASGVVELHQYAGFSGGSKTVAVGLAGEETIGWLHSLEFITQPGVGLGKVEGNPFREALEEIGRMAGLKFVVNVVRDAFQQYVAVATGPPRAVFSRLWPEAKRLITERFGRSFRLVVAGVGYPKDNNLYQLSRAVTYLALGDPPLVERGGVIVLPAPLPEGAGAGVAEQRFFAALCSGMGPAEMLAQARACSRPQPGLQRAYMLARALERCRVVVAGCSCPEVVRKAGLVPAEDMSSAIRKGRRLAEADEILVLPAAMQVLAS